LEQNADRNYCRAFTDGKIFNPKLEQKGLTELSIDAERNV
jgi:hypothetical protein